MKKIGEQQLTYSRNIGQGALAGYNIALNVFDGLSRVNHKHQEWTTRDGHVLGALCDITVRTTVGEQFTTDLFGLGNTWIVRNAFRKFHFLRDKMFADAGIKKSEMGKYGHTLRPNLLPTDKWEGTLNADFTQTYAGASLNDADWANGEVEFFTIQGTQTDGGGELVRNGMTEELDFTRLTSARPNDEMDLQSVVEMFDEWDLHIILNHIVEDTTGGRDAWSSVAMLQAYLEDRMAEIPDATSQSSIVAKNNPLAALSSQSATSGVVTEIAQEQELENPPYNIKVDNSGVQLVLKGFLTLEAANLSTYSGNKVSERKITNVFLPAGWLTFYSQTNNFDMDIDVKGIFECRDVA